jgi:ribosomal protein L17
LAAEEILELHFFNVFLSFSLQLPFSQFLDPAVYPPFNSYSTSATSSTSYPTLLLSTTMAQGPKFRHLSRNSAHRQALLRNLVTSLLKHESITTTWAKAKETQRMAEKLITAGKKDTVAARKKALETLYVFLLFLFFGHWIQANRRRPPTTSSPNSSAPSANATLTVPAATPGSCASSPKRMTRRRAPFSSLSTGRRICGLR